MLKQTLGAIALCAAAAVHAQSTQSPWSGFVGMGFTGGGETLVTVTYSDGSSENIKSGGLVEFKAGVDYRLAGSPWSVQGSVGYHTDNTSAANGSVRFSRFPLELLGFWHPGDRVRLGGGLRYASGAKLSSSGVVAGLGTHDVDSSAGVVLEGEFRVTPQLGLGVRYVMEEYEFTGTRTKVDGNHVGVRLNYYF